MTGSKADTPSHSWEEYYRAHDQRPPRQQLLDVLEHFPKALPHEPDPAVRRAIDLGCGNGHETLHLLANGWHVLAIDAQQEAIDRLLARTPGEHRPRLTVRTATFEQLSLPGAHLIHAAFSLPFCPPEHFPAFWQKVRASLEPGGWVVGQFFGPRDTWATDKTMTFHTREQVESLLAGLHVEKLIEDEHDRDAVSGPKHWHIFHVTAQRLIRESRAP